MTVPRPAATVCLLRDGGGGIEVLMGRRSPTARFMADVWVFPGGAIDDGDGAHRCVAGPDADLAWRSAALRELVEELGIWITTGGVFTSRVPGDVYAAAADRGLVLDGHALGYFANWVTPEPLPIRFDTRFFAAAADAEPEVDGRELVDARWVRPAWALGDGGLPMAFPTVRTLRDLARFPTAAEAMAHIAERGEIATVEPRLTVGDDGLGVLLPGDPGFEGALGDADVAAAVESMLEGDPGR